MSKARDEALAVLATEVHGCRRCPRLVEWREAQAADPPKRYRGHITLVRDPETNDLVASVQLTNTGSTTAFNVGLSSALLGATPPSDPLPVLGDLAPGASATAAVRFPASAGVPGTPGVLRLLVTYTGGSCLESRVCVDVEIDSKAWRMR